MPLWSGFSNRAGGTLALLSSERKRGILGPAKYRYPCLGGATCRDILALIQMVRETVKKGTGVVLEPEVRLLGCSLDPLE